MTYSRCHSNIMGRGETFSANKWRTKNTNTSRRIFGDRHMPRHMLAVMSSSATWSMTWPSWTLLTWSGHCPHNLCEPICLPRALCSEDAEARKYPKASGILSVGLSNPIPAVFSSVSDCFRNVKQVSTEHRSEHEKHIKKILGPKLSDKNSEPFWRSLWQVLDGTRRRLVDRRSPP